MAVINGGSGADNLNGTTGKDQIYGKDGNDNLWGNDDDDLVVGGAGKDIIRGGHSKGTYTYTSSNTAVQLKASDAAYKNTVGYYIKDANGNPIDGKIIWADAKNPGGTTVNIPNVDPSKIGYFIIPNAAALNSGANALTNGADVSFVKVGGVWKVHLDSNPNSSSYIAGQGAFVFFDNKNLNADGFAHTKTLSDGSVGFEDLVNGGDKDFNDVVIKSTSTSQQFAINGGDQLWGGNVGGKGDGAKDVFIFNKGDQVHTVNDLEKAWINYKLLVTPQHKQFILQWVMTRSLNYLQPMVFY